MYTKRPALAEVCALRVLLVLKCHRSISLLRYHLKISIHFVNVWRLPVPSQQLQLLILIAPQANTSSGVRQKTAIKIIRRTINVIEKNNNRSTSLVFFVVLTYRKRRNINAIQAVSDCHA